jgi:hypothetical protein
MGQFILKLRELNYIFKYYIHLLCQFIFPVQFALWLYIVNTTVFFTALLQAQGNIHSTGPSKSSRTNDEGVAVSSEIDLEDNSYFIPLSEIINVPARLQRNLEKRKAESTSSPFGGSYMIKDLAHLQLARSRYKQHKANCVYLG